MTAQIELFKSELAHDFDLIGGHFALAVVAVIRQASRFARASITAQVGGNKREMLGQLWRDFVPDRVRLRVAVQEQQCWTTSTNHTMNLEAILEFEIVSR